MKFNILKNGQLLISTLLITSLSFHVSISQTWIQLSNYPDSLAWYGAAGFSINGKGYVGGAGGNGSLFTKAFYEYDPYSDSWTQKSSFPDSSDRRTVAYFSIDDYGYMGLGWTGSMSLYSFYQYDPENDTWTKKTDYPGKAGRTIHYTSLNGKGYIGGGSVSVGDYQKDFWQYDPVSDSWTQKADLTFGRVAGLAFAIDSLVYITCGRFNSVSLNDLWAYSPVTNSWTKKANFPGVGRINPIGFVLNGKAVVGGGYVSGTTIRLSDYYEYDPATNLWTPVPGFSSGNRSVGASFTIHNEGYTCMGIDSTGSGYLKDFWKYSHCTVNYTEDAMSICDSLVSPSGKFIWTTAGLHYDTLMDSKGCDSLLKMDLSGGAIDRTITQGSVAIQSNESKATSYQWIICGDSSGVLMGDTFQTLTNVQFGLSYAVIIHKYGCLDTSECVFTYPVGIENVMTSDEIEVYPNPNGGDFILELPLENQRIDVRMINSNGQIVAHWNFTDRRKMELSNDLPSGIYSLIITYDSGVIRKPVLIE